VDVVYVLTLSAMYVCAIDMTVSNGQSSEKVGNGKSIKDMNLIM